MEDFGDQPPLESVSILAVLLLHRKVTITDADLTKAVRDVYKICDHAKRIRDERRAAAEKAKAPASG